MFMTVTQIRCRLGRLAIMQTGLIPPVACSRSQSHRSKGRSPCALLTSLPQHYSILRECPEGVGAMISAKSPSRSSEVRWNKRVA